MAVAVVLGFWRLGLSMAEWGARPIVSDAVAALLALGCCWAAYRLVNLPRFADFLIAVEAEMNKVSWPTRGELFRASLVVLFTVFALSVVLFTFDFVWGWLFTDILHIR